MIKDTYVIRGDSERQVEMKVKKFIDVRDVIHDEEWTYDKIEHKPARLLNYKPFFCRLYRVEDDV